MMMGPAITTTTFIRGPIEEGRKVLKGRLLLVLQANPWLCGTLIKKGCCDKVVQLNYPASVKEGDVEVEKCFLDDGNKGGASVSSNMDYVSVCKGVANTKSEVPPGSKSVKSKCSQCVLSVLPDSQNPDTFVVVLSISHVIIDGFNYYQILGMLSDANKEILSLSCKRKHTIEEEASNAIGKAEYKWMTGGGVICNVVCGMLCGSKPTIACFAVDEKKVQGEKDAAASQARGGFVSTNDVIVSSFGSINSSDWLFMPLNFRNKLPAYNDNDAGNYEGSLLFGKGEYDSPADIRNCLKSGPPKYTRGANISGQADGKVPLPGCWGSTRAKMAMAVSWVFNSFSEYQISNCEQLIHFPHTDCSLIPFDLCVTFKPRAGKTAVALFSRSTDEKGLVEGCPVGAKVASAASYHAGSNAA